MNARLVGLDEFHQPRGRRWIGIISVLMATILWAAIGSSVRFVHADSWTIMFWRGAFSGLAVLVVAIYRHRAQLPHQFLDLGIVGLGYVIASATGTILYILAIQKTSIADVAVIYATMPFLVEGIVWRFFRLTSGVRTMIASAVALIGVVLTAGGASSAVTLGGQAIALLMTLMYATQVVIMRHRSAFSVLPVVCLASLFASSASLPFAHPFSVPVKEILTLAMSGIIYGALGDVLFAYGAQIIPSTQAALLTTLDVPLSALFAWLPQELRRE